MSNRWTRQRQRPRDQEPGVVIHFDDLPDKDVTTLDGTPLTTPVRTVLDIAPDLDDDHLRRIVDSAVRRGSLTVEQLLERASEPDMRDRPGARRVQRLIGTS